MISLDRARVAGMSDRQTRGMVERGQWRRPYRGVFIDSRASVTPMQPVIAAFFAVNGLASHRLGLWVWHLVSRSTPDVLEFTVPYGRGSRVPGVEIHRVTTMPEAFFKGVVAVTSPMRALLDTASVAPDLVPDAMVRAFTAKLFTPRTLEAEIERASTHGKPGVVALRAALNDLGVGRFTPSQLERRARRLFRACGLPPPQVEVVFGEHGEYRRDFRKQNRIVIGNHWILRYDWYDVVEDAERTAEEVVEAYRARTALLLR